MLVGVPTDAEITFADHVGRFYARRYGMAPMVGRLLGYLTVCDPRDQSIAELADALLASRSAIAGAVNTLEALHLVLRSRTAGERMDRVRIDMTSPNATGFDLSDTPSRASWPAKVFACWPTPRPNGERSCWSGPRSPISWSSAFPCWSRSGRSSEKSCKPQASSPRRPVPHREGRADDSARPTPGIAASHVFKSFGEPAGARRRQT